MNPVLSDPVLVCTHIVLIPEGDPLLIPMNNNNSDKLVFLQSMQLLRVCKEEIQCQNFILQYPNHVTLHSNLYHNILIL